MLARAALLHSLKLPPKYRLTIHNMVSNPKSNSGLDPGVARGSSRRKPIVIGCGWFWPMYLRIVRLPYIVCAIYAPLAGRDMLYYLLAASRLEATSK